MFGTKEALNEHFSFDLQDIRLNRVLAEDTLDMLCFLTEGNVSLQNVLTGKDGTQ